MGNVEEFEHGCLLDFVQGKCVIVNTWESFFAHGTEQARIKGCGPVNGWGTANEVNLQVCVIAEVGFESKGLDEFASLKPGTKCNKGFTLLFRLRG